MMLAVFISSFIAATNQPMGTVNLGGFNTVVPTNIVLTQVVKQHSNVISNNTYNGTVPIYWPSCPGFSVASMNTSGGDGYTVVGTNFVGTGTGKITTLQSVFNTSPLSANVWAPPANITTNAVITYQWLNFTSGLPETSCLQYKSYTNLVARTNGSYMTFYKNGWSMPTAPPYITTNCWLLGVTNAFCMGYFNPDNGQNRSVLVPISPRHCVTEAHVGNMGNVIFVGPDGVTLYTNSVLQAYVVPSCGQPQGSSDLSVCLMSNNVPAFMKVFPCQGNVMNKIDQYYTYSATVVRYRNGTAEMLGNSNAFSSFCSVFSAWAGGNILSNCCQANFSQPGNGIDPNPGPNPYFGHYGTYGDTWVNGDSSSPAMLIIDNEAFLIAQAWYQGSGPSHDTNLVNAAMYYLSTNNAAPVYQETPIDPSKVPDL